MNKPTLTKEIVLGLGFKEIPHFTVTDSLTYDLGRNRYLSIGCLGTPNEMLFISETDKDDPREVTDLIVLHNYDYDGYLKESKLRMLLECLK